MRRILTILIAFSFGLGWTLDGVAQPKPLAPGVLKIIDASIDARDSSSLPMPLLGLDAQPFAPNFAPVLDTLHGQSQNVVFFRDVWQYEFGFLGLRQVELPIATASGIRTENVWYLVYRIRNTGINVSYDKIQEDERFEHIKNSLQRNKTDFEVKSKFKLDFYLNGWVKQANGEYQSVVYRDQVYPEELRQIRQVEDKNRFLMDKVEMMFARFPLAKSADDGGRWGVAIWKDVDPRIDYVSVTVRGLTNAFRISTTPDNERKFKYRNLQLNFWRPGDSVRQAEDTVTYGIPLVDDPVRQVEICQRYQLPGPLIRGYLVSDSADQNVLIAEMDAKIQFSDFKSTITPALDQGNFPPEIKSAFEKAGVEIPDGTSINQLVPGKKWSFEGLMSGKKQNYLIVVEPQFWEPQPKGIRFIKSLDHLWIYR